MIKTSFLRESLKRRIQNHDLRIYEYNVFVPDMFYYKLGWNPLRFRMPPIIDLSETEYIWDNSLWV